MSRLHEGLRSAPARRGHPRMRWVRHGAAVSVLVLLAVLPYVTVTVPGLLPGRVNGPGSMQLLALCLVMAGIALSYDVLFGRTGLLSFGHALFVAAGSYVTAVVMRQWGLSLWAAALLALVAGAVLALVVGAIALRVSGIAFAMVTLAFAQGASIIVLRDPGSLTGGEEGLPLDRSGTPDLLTGVTNAPYRYWMALAFVTLAFLVVAWVSRSRAGHVWAAVRENPLRAGVLGVSTYRATLLAMLVGSVLGTLGGVLHLVVVGGANPHLTTTEFTLSLLVMVVIGGAGSRWGAVVGGFLYTYADARLVDASGSSLVQQLPDVLRVPLSQPLFVLGMLFVLVVYFAPGGVTGLTRKGVRDVRR